MKRSMKRRRGGTDFEAFQSAIEILISEAPIPRHHRDNKHKGIRMIVNTKLMKVSHVLGLG